MLLNVLQCTARPPSRITSAKATPMARRRAVPHGAGSVATHRHLHFLTSPPGRDQGLTQKDACWSPGRRDRMTSSPRE